MFDPVNLKIRKDLVNMAGYLMALIEKIEGLNSPLSEP
jgi:hypothetical protein